MQEDADNTSLSFVPDSNFTFDAQNNQTLYLLAQFTIFHFENI